MDFNKIRQSTDAKLAGRVDALRAGEDVAALESFAKAYLGMFLEIDDDVAPPARVALLASEPYASAVLDGFVAVLDRTDIPTPADIGRALAADRLLAIGYVVLAGVERRASEEPERVLELPDGVLGAALCFHFANAPTQPHPWVNTLIGRRPDLAAPALHAFWAEQLSTTVEHLPGLSRVLRDDGARAVLQANLLPLLRTWRGCRHHVLRSLLTAAMRHGDHEELLEAARSALDESDLELRKRADWMATAFLLAPEEFGPVLADYAGRSREKILRLLDFIVPALRAGEADLPAAWLAQLLRLAAPIFRRNEPSTGGLDAVSTQVLWLFERLGDDPSDAAVQAVAELRKVRVMRIYRDVLEQVAARQTAARGEAPSA